ncbi:MAG TPA: hypothetical protein VFU36_12040 [Jatrophihabitans sp.]|nr:hypothetical protein [Jatrophihabitans sp.]
MPHFDPVLFWTAVGALAAVAGAAAAFWFGLIGRPKRFNPGVEAIMDSPHRAIKVFLRASGKGQVIEVTAVRGHNVTYPTLQEFPQHRLPHNFEPDETLEVFLRPSGSETDPKATFDIGSGESALKVFVRLGRGEPLVIPVRVDKNAEWPAAGGFVAEPSGPAAGEPLPGPARPTVGTAQPTAGTAQPTTGPAQPPVGTAQPPAAPDPASHDETGSPAGSQ